MFQLFALQAKNKINLYYLLIGSFLCFSSFRVSIVQSQDLAIGDWQSHLSYVKATCVEQVGSSIFVGTESALFSYDTEDSSIDTYSTVEGLSELDITSIGYNTAMQTLVIAYSNANLDLMRPNGILNISDIKRASILGDKRVNSIFMQDSLAYLACSFGIVVLDIKREEIKDTYIVGAEGANIKINQLAIGNGWIRAATDGGVYEADINSPNLSNFNNWSINQSLPSGAAKQIVFFNDEFYYGINNVLYDGTNYLPVYGSADWCFKSLKSTNGKMVLSEWQASCDSPSSNRITTINASLTYDQRSYWDMYRPLDAILDGQDAVWASDNWRGLVKVLPSNSGSVILPNGPRTNTAFRMQARNGELWVGAGGVKSSWSANRSSSGFYKYKEGEWTSYNKFTTPIMADEDIRDILQVQFHPNQNKVFFASYGEGLLEYDYADFNLYNAANSTLQQATGDSPGIVRVSGVAFDPWQNMWVCNYLAPQPISVQTPEGEWISFTPTININDNSLRDIITDNFGQKWMIYHRNGIVVFNHGVDFSTEEDDSYKHYSTADGLPVSEVNAIAKDLEGNIWAGTNEGIVVFYCPGSVFNGGCAPTKPRVEVDGFGAYLLEAEAVTAIAVDGANRKWVGTENGLFVISPDGIEQVEYYNKDNSPLLSNSITTLAIDGSTGQVFVGTSLGIVSLKAEAVEGSSTHGDVVIYPNPVRGDYTGKIAVKGLATDAFVKFTDVNGRLVYETRALGSQAVWDGADYNGRKAASGVYLVFSTTVDGKETFVGKFVILR